MLAEADKGRTMLVTYKDENTEKKFIHFSHTVTFIHSKGIPPTKTANESMKHCNKTTSSSTKIK
jgi:hypothetical protein